MLGYSEAFDNAAWFKGLSTVTANQVAAPNGTVTADQVDFSAAANANIQPTSAVSVVSGSVYTFSVWARANTTVSNVKIAIQGTDTSQSITTSWQRLFVTFTSNATTVSPTLVTRDSVAATIYLWGAQLSDSASLDPYTPNFGAAPSAAAAYGPRLDYDPSTLAAKGLLVEEQRTNLFSYSAEFNNAYWAKLRTSVTANAATAPDGTTSAEKLVEDTSNNTHFLYRFPVTGTLNAVYTFSVYAKASERSWIYLNAGDGFTSGSTAYYDLSTGTVGTVGAGATASISSAGNGWYRCVITATASTGTLLGLYMAPATGNNGVTYLGNGTSGIFLWGAQLEAGAFATSYIPTDAATVTRNADVASVGVSQFPYSATEGTIVANVTSLGNFNFNSLVDLNDSTVSNRIGLRYNSVSASNLTVSSAGSIQVTLNPGVPSASASKLGSVYKTNDFAAAYNGGTVATTASGSLPVSVTKMDIGNLVGAAGTFLNGHIRQITYLPRRISNAELQTRTT